MLSFGPGGPRLLTLRILGRLEVLAGGRPVRLGGGRQRSVLAALALRSNEVVSAESLLDDVWGETASPPTRHALEVAVSRLRRTLEDHEVEARIETHPAGYRLLVEPGLLDAHRFEELVAASRAAAEDGDAAQAFDLLTEGLSLWRGEPLEDVALEGTALREIERLSELRLAVIEERIDAALDLGRHVTLVSELRSLVAQHPFRERLHGQLLLALYRSGRQAEAIAAYERTRRLLDERLGIQPSRELRDLSARIVRQDPSLDLPRSSAPAAAGPARGAGAERVQSVRLRSSRLRLLGALVGAAAVAAILLATTPAGDRLGAREPHGVTRVVLVVESDLQDATDSPYLSLAIDGLRRAEHEFDVVSETVKVGPPATLAEETSRVLAGDPDLVLVLAPYFVTAVADAARRLPKTHFVLVDTSAATPELRGLANVTGITFAEHEAGYVVGYLGGLIEQERSPRLNEARIVSVVAGVRSPSVHRSVAGFRAGAKHAFPDVRVLVDYSNDSENQYSCELLANRQLDRGSDIVFAVAGSCGFGALSAAGVRGAWAVGADADLSYLGPHILASAIKRLDRAVLLSVRWFTQDRLPAGDIVLRLQQNGVGIEGISPDVPAEIRAKAARIAAAIRARSLTVPPDPPE